MTNILERTSNTITIAEFWENEELKKYNYDPPYQRLSVWSDEKQSFFIDSLLRNYPVPPIFLHKKINDATGKQSFDVIDGKQRLTSIIRFIKNEIPAISDNGIDSLSGVYFKDLDFLDDGKFKKLFWRYELQIQYVDTEDRAIIDNLFDRLNRNGAPLSGQELRHAKYHESYLLKSINDLSEIDFWKERTKKYDLARMEDKEFISELLFMIIEQKPLEARTQQFLDNLYEQYKDTNELIDENIGLFKSVTEFLSSLSLNYDKYAIYGVSHMYGLWCFSYYCIKNHKKNIGLTEKLEQFYNEFKKPRNQIENEFVKTYKDAMISNTKALSQRQKRMNALIMYAFNECSI